MKLLILGGNGYVGAPLALHLMGRGHEVTVYDIREVEWLAGYMGAGIGRAIRGDIRDVDNVRNAMKGCEAVIHLACISNDPASEIAPTLTKSINLDCFLPCVEAAKDMGVKRFIYASSSSVYGIKSEPDVTEDLPLQPLTDYSRYKAECEKILLDNKGDMEAVVIRHATVCGMSPNLRLDLAVHILTIAAMKNGVIKVDGGAQLRPNIHIQDLITAYELVLLGQNVDGEIFNVVNQNLSIMDTAVMIKNVLGGNIKIEVTENRDARSYHVCGQKFVDHFHYAPYRPIGEAVMELRTAWDAGIIGDDTAAKYHRIKSTKEIFGG